MEAVLHTSTGARPKTDFKAKKPEEPTGCSRKDLSQPSVLFGKEMVFSPEDKACVLTVFSRYITEGLQDHKKQMKKTDILTVLAAAGPNFNGPNLR